jgi:hypothetical protein
MITLGSDVELVIHNASNVPVDVTGMLGGSKDEPVWFDNFNVQEDNVNAEYAINPVQSIEDWVLYHKQAISKVSDLLPEGYGILFDASTEYDVAQLESTSSKVFGCDPDNSAWSGMPNRSPNIHRAGNMRTCGGHIHVGIDGLDSRDLIKCMDVFLGLPSLFIDTDTRRRQLYGKAGSYRDKPYGVEYRALSNFWAKDDEGMEWAYDQTIKAVDFCMSDGLASVPNLTNIPRSIDQYDLNAAETTLNWLIKEGIN